MHSLIKVRLRPLPNGNFVLDAYDHLGCHIKKELRFVELRSCMLCQDHLTLEFKKGKKYEIWLCDLDFSKPWVPLYIRGGRQGEGYLRILYDLAAEVSQYVFGFSKEINRDYLRSFKDSEKFWKNQDMDVMLRILLRAAGKNIPAEHGGKWQREG